MKNKRCNYSGFTLVELLVVIAIIATLAAVLTVSANSVINASTRTKPSNSATKIQTAITNFYTEYGLYPLTSSQSGADVLEGSGGQSGNDEQALFYALCGNINAYAPTTASNSASGVSNTRNIAYLTPKKSEVDTNGVMVNGFSGASGNGPYYYFTIAIDADYSGVLGDSGNVMGAMPDFTGQYWKSNSGIAYMPNGITQGIAVWSCCDTANLTNWGQSKSPTLWVHTY